jgi:hypothetical protein
MTRKKDDPAEAQRDKYRHLLLPVRIEDTITSQETTPERDPESGRPYSNDGNASGVGY